MDETAESQEKEFEHEDRKGSKEEHKQELQRWMKMYVRGIMTNNGKYHFGGCPV
jgi:hypothetical protein